MKNTLVVVTDLGCLKAFKLQNHEPDRSPRLELIEEFKLAEAHTHLVDQVSDASGRFPRGSGKSSSGGAMSDGERHNIELEKRKRLLRQVASRLNLLARTPEFERCFVAVSKEMQHALLDELDPQVRAKIQKVVPADLTKVDRSELLRHF